MLIDFSFHLNIVQVGTIGTGAGHGAQGGSASGNDGGDTYDMTQLPNQQGSGGGISSSGVGGAGGGYFKAEIETLTVDGKKYTSQNLHVYINREY